MPALRCLFSYLFLRLREWVQHLIAIMLDESMRTVDPKGLALVLLVVSIFFLIPTGIVVILRCFIRLKYRLFGIDDGLMLIGWILHVIFSVVGVRAIYAGLGTKDEHLNAYLQVDGRKWMWIGQVFYSLSLTPIKASICVTLLRIAVTKTHRIIVWATLIFTIVTMLYHTIGTFFACMPITANWDDRTKCSLPFLMSVGYMVSLSAVVSDWICAILPIFMLYKSLMRKATKVSVSIILGLGILGFVVYYYSPALLEGFFAPRGLFISRCTHRPLVYSRIRNWNNRWMLTVTTKTRQLSFPFRLIDGQLSNSHYTIFWNQQSCHHIAVRTGSTPDSSRRSWR
ncbi:hypothetical protein FOXYSP1_15858 [Fusarium oxysporum f. sp. phaseoli]